MGRKKQFSKFLLLSIAILSMSIFVKPVEATSSMVNWEVCTATWGRSDFNNFDVPSSGTINITAQLSKNMSTNVKKTIWNVSSNMTKYKLEQSGYDLLPKVRFGSGGVVSPKTWKRASGCKIITLPNGTEPFSLTHIE